MGTQSIGVYSRRGDLVGMLQSRCPSWTFAGSGPEREGARVVVIDSDSLELLDSPPKKSIVRIILGESSDKQRRNGEVRVLRDVFLAAPAEYVGFAVDLGDAVTHASQLEQDLDYLTQIHQLMAMVEEEQVSERITRTVLGMLNLPTGTLFLHDPRLERYVVSYSNDGEQRETGEFLPAFPPICCRRRWPRAGTSHRSARPTDGAWW